jgi:LysR family malonate utilization transcriptional regulator
MSFDITSDLTFRKLSIFMTFMEKGNIARTAETLGLSGCQRARARCLSTRGVTYCPSGGLDIAGVLPGSHANHGARSGRSAQDGGYRPESFARRHALFAHAGNRPPLIMGMKLRRPDLEMDLTMGSNETLLHKLEEGSLDAILISISESELDSANLEMLPLFHDEIFLAAPAPRN